MLVPSSFLLVAPSGAPIEVLEHSPGTPDGGPANLPVYLKGRGLRTLHPLADARGSVPNSEARDLRSIRLLATQCVQQLLEAPAAHFQAGPVPQDHLAVAVLVQPEME
jgi:hypothetical protein